MQESHVVVKQFIYQIGEKQLSRYYENLSSFASKGRFAKLYVNEYFAMELGVLGIVSDVIERPNQPIDEEYLSKHIEALGFITSFVEITKRAPEHVTAELTGKVQGLMNELRTLHDANLELQTIISLMNKGWKIRFSKKQNGTFDTLAVKGNLEIEVECKFISSDKGKKIHNKEAAFLGDQLLKSLENFLNQQHLSHLFLISFDDGLTNSSNFIQQVSNSFRDFAEKSISPPSNSKYSFEKYDLDIENESNESLFQEKLLKFSIATTKLDIKKVLYLQRPETNTRIAVALTCKKRDNVLAYIYRELKHSANTQFSKSRAGMFNCYLEGVDHHSLPTLAANSGLQGVSGRIFRSEERRHVKQINYLVKPTPSVSQSSTQSSTSVLSFPSAFLTEDEKNIFTSLFS